MDVAALVDGGEVSLMPSIDRQDLAASAAGAVAAQVGVEILLQDFGQIRPPSRDLVEGRDGADEFAAAAAAAFLQAEQPEDVGAVVVPGAAVVGLEGADIVGAGAGLARVAHALATAKTEE